MKNIKENIIARWIMIKLYFVRLMAALTNQPMIWTIMGNMPAEKLQMQVTWENTDTYTKFVETYTYNGVLVKQSAHVLAKQGFEPMHMEASQL
jgi:hypothetical protein